MAFVPPQNLTRPTFWLLTGALTLLVGACVAPSRPPNTAPAPAPATTAVAPPLADRHAGDWSVADLSPGEWRYSQAGPRSMAVFSASAGMQMALTCESGTITLARGSSLSGANGQLRLRTSFGERVLPARPLAGSSPAVGAALPARDPLFDQLIYSRGRFLLESSGQAPLIVPTRPEIARLVEDCRR